MAVGVLEHGVAPLQGRQGRQRPGPGPVVGDVVGARSEPVVEGTAAAVAKLVDLGGALVEQPARVAQHRPGPERVETGLLAGQPATEHLPEPVPGGADQPELLGHVRHHELGGVGGRGRADVGDQVEQRLVLLVADRRDDRRAQPWTARTSASSENGSRSSTDPPPRATTMTSTSALRSSRPSASITSAAARWPCMVA